MAVAMNSGIRIGAALALWVLSLGMGAAQEATSVPNGLDSVAGRIAGRDFPSIFQPWNGAENLRALPDERAVPLSGVEAAAATTARHDLYFSDWRNLGLKLRPGLQYVVLTPEFTPESIEAARSNRARLLAANPQMVILAEIHYFSASKSYLPADSPWWKHDELNDRFESTNTEYRSSRLDFSIPAFQDKVAAMCGALVRTEVFDGCMMDWWHDNDEMGADRVTLIRSSLDTPWPPGPFDLLVLSEVAYYLQADALASVLRRECPRLAPGANIVAAHWRHAVADYPLTGDAAHTVISQTPGLTSLGCYRDSDVIIEVFDTGDGRSVAAREGLPGAR